MLKSKDGKVFLSSLIKKGRGQEAEGRRKELLIKTLVMGLKRHCLNPILLSVGSFCPLPSYFCLLKPSFYSPSLIILENMLRLNST
jgi:hypothetical protein